MSERSCRRAAARREIAARRRELRLAGLTAVTLGIGAALAPGASAATLQVTSLADAPANACDDDCTLRDAITLANADAAPDTITFASGLSGTITLGSEILVQAATTITGPGADVLTISGADTTRMLSISLGVVGAAGDSVAISGLTFADGRIEGGGGGAITANQASLRLTGTAFTGNDAAKYGDGGAVFAGNGTLTVSDSSFTKNTAASSGGSIATSSAGLSVSGSAISSSTAGKYGGGISVGGTGADQPTSVTDTVISASTARKYGGGFSGRNLEGPVTVTRSSVSENTAEGNGRVFGGGRTGDGGGLHFTSGAVSPEPVTVRDSTIDGNAAPNGAGGGISFARRLPDGSSVVNSTITGNSAMDGGGIQFGGLNAELATFALRSATVTRNTATGTGGGILRGDLTEPGGQSALALRSTVVADNTAPSGADVAATPQATGALTIGNSLVRDLTGVDFIPDPAGTVLTNRDPLLGALADNGGPTRTQLPAAESPLVDAGLAGGLTSDQRGSVRTFDTALVAQTLGSDGTDIGAVERTMNAPPTLQVPGPQSVAAGAKLAFSTQAGNRVTVDDPEKDPVTVTLSVERGTLSLPSTVGLTFSQGDGKDDAQLRFTGALGDVQAALDGLSYTASADAGGTSVTLSARVEDVPPKGASGPRTATGTVPIAVSSAATPPSSQPALCNGAEITLRPQLVNGRVALNGIALVRFAGQTVEIKAGKEVVGTTVIGADGSFGTTLPAPPADVARKVTYQAVLPTAHSTSYRLERETTILTVDGRTVTGRVKLGKRRRPVVGIVYRDDSCTTRQRVGKIKISTTGRFKTTLPPSADEFTSYRIRVRLNRRSVSWTAVYFRVPKG